MNKEAEERANALKVEFFRLANEFTTETGFAINSVNFSLIDVTFIDSGGTQYFYDGLPILTIKK